MLNRLHIKNYALIDHLDISFGQGLNLITGETGAGKSIIMGALSLILGQRAENRFLFDPTRKCVIEGYFELSNYDLTSFFEEFDLDYEAESIFRRELTADGKSRAFINDTPVNLNILKKFSERLIDIHSQHATLQLANVDFQLMVLDSVAGTHGLRSEFSGKLRAYRDAVSNLKRLEEEAALAAATLDYKQFLLTELDDAHLFEGEQTALELEQQKLEHAEEIKGFLQNALDTLQEREYNVEDNLKEATQSLEKAARVLPALQDASDRLQSCYLEIKDLVMDLQREEQSVVLDQGRLEEVNDRLSTLFNLQQKHRVDNESALLAIRKELQDALDVVFSNTTLIDKMEADCLALQEDLGKRANALHQERLKVVPQVSAQILQTLAQVGMPDSQLEIVLTALDASGYRVDGGDSVQFLFSSNKGQLPQPVGKVASGGELSRLMLAIKSLVASHSALPTIIFDEIDTGISGEVALQVGKVMESLGQTMQVLAIRDRKSVV